MGKISLVVLALVAFFLSFPSQSLSAVFNVNDYNSLEDALRDAQDNREDDEIILAPGVYNVRSMLKYIADYDEKYSLTLRAQDPNNPPELVGDGDNPILYIDTEGLSNDGGVNIVIDGLIFKNGNNDTGNTELIEINGVVCGGALAVYTLSASLEVRNSNFVNNYSYEYGGGICMYTDEGTTTIFNSTFESNEAYYDDGGGVYVYTDDTDVEVLIEDSKFIGNTAWEGGGLAVESPDWNVNVTIRRTEFSNNTARRWHGGGVYIDENRKGSLTIEDSSFIGNKANKNGGAVYESSGGGGVVISIKNSKFERNEAINYHGGAIYIIPSEGTISHNRFISNKSGDLGGGVFINGIVSIVNNVFMENTAGISGGAIYGLNIPDIVNNTFLRNTSQVNGGGVHWIIDSNMTFDAYNNLFWRNEAADKGDDMYLDVKSGTTVNLFNNNFSGNANFDNPTSEDLYINASGAYTYNHADNIQEDPLLVPDDIHLTDRSPMINKGNNNAPALPGVDIDGDDRIIFGTVDIGADESESIYIEEEENLFDSRKLKNSSTLSIEDGLFSTVNELDTSPYNCDVPDNVLVLTGWVRFIAKVDTGKRGVWITLTLPEPVGDGIRVGKCTQKGYKEIADVEVSGNSVRFFIEDGGEFDYDGRRDGYVRDPFAIIKISPEESSTPSDSGGETSSPSNPGEAPQESSDQSSPATGPNVVVLDNSDEGGCSAGGGSVIAYLLMLMVAWAVRFVRREWS